jgi:hypothetical protein
VTALRRKMAEQFTYAGRHGKPMRASTRLHVLGCVAEGRSESGILLDEGIHGDHYEEDSIVLEPDASHFDLLEPTRIERYVDSLVQRLRHGTSPSHLPITRLRPSFHLA